MTQKEKYRKQKKDKKRYEVLRTFMSSFTLTAIVVVAVAISIPKSPVATIKKINAFEHEIAYEVIVTDEESAIDPNTLKIVLDGQLEDYEYPLALGHNIGLFENLRPDTGYQLEVYGNKGFGLEKLTSMRVETTSSSNGAIIGYELIDELDFYLTYELDILISDPNLSYLDVYLYYTYLYPDEEPLTYDAIPLIIDDQKVELLDVPNEHTTIDLYIEATLDTGEKVILDTLVFHTPFKLDTYLDLNQKTKSSLNFYFYEDYNMTEDITYIAEIYDNVILEEEKEIVISKDMMSHDSTTFMFDGLRKDRNYTIIVKAIYKNPYTLKEETKILHEEDFTTLGDYDIDFERTSYDTYDEIHMYLNDPNHYFQVPYYIIYEIVDGMSLYYEEQFFDFTPDGDGKSSTFEIIKPNLENYQIIIGVRSHADYQIDHVIIDEIIEN